MKSESAPEYLFFRIESIDERLPSGDDGASWPALLTNYQPNGFADQYLILSKNSEKSTINMIPLSRASYQIGDWVNLPEKNAKLFASIDLEQSWQGKIKNLLYKSSPLLINLRLQDNSIRHFRLIPGSGKSPFLLSPFIENAREFSFLYNRMDALNKNRVTAFSISVDGNIKDWNEDYQISLETIQ
jgi:hypothetical protein